MDSQYFALSFSPTYMPKHLYVYPYIQNRQKERLQQEKSLMEAYYWSYLKINKDKILPKSKLYKLN
jgi:hypothetical protein